MVPLDQGAVSGPDSESDTFTVRFIAKIGVLIIASGATSLVGLAITYSSDPKVESFGSQVFRFGLLTVFLLGDYMTANLALRAWRQYHYVAWWLLFVGFVLATAGVVAGLFLSQAELRDDFYYGVVITFVLAIFVSIFEDRRRKSRTGKKD